MKKINKKLNKAIKKLNPGIIIPLDKNVCPLLSSHIADATCTKSCVAYRHGYDINVVNPKEADNYFKTNTDWINELTKQGWCLHQKFIYNSPFQPEQTTYLFVKKNNINRCIAFKEN